MECKTCKHAKRRGWKMVFCTLYGIDISADYDQCKTHTDKISGPEDGEQEDKNGKIA